MSKRYVMCGSRVPYVSAEFDVSLAANPVTGNANSANALLGEEFEIYDVNNDARMRVVCVKNSTGSTLTGGLAVVWSATGTVGLNVELPGGSIPDRALVAGVLLGSISNGEFGFACRGGPCDWTSAAAIAAAASRVNVTATSGKVDDPAASAEGTYCGLSLASASGADVTARILMQLPKLG